MPRLVARAGKTYLWSSVLPFCDYAKNGEESPIKSFVLENSVVNC
jgi:hypothetical protein